MNACALHLSHWNKILMHTSTDYPLDVRQHTSHAFHALALAPQSKLKQILIITIHHHSKRRPIAIMSASAGSFATVFPLPSFDSQPHLTVPVPV